MTNTGRIETRIIDVRYEVKTLSRISSGYKKGKVHHHYQQQEVTVHTV